MNTNWVTKYFPETKKIEAAYKEYRDFVEKAFYPHCDPLSEARKGFFLGSDQFMQSIVTQYLPKKKNDLRDISGLRDLKKDVVFPFVARSVGSVALPPKDKDKILAYLLKKYSPLSLDEIGGRLAKPRGFYAVSKICIRLESDRGSNARLDKTLSALEKSIMSNVQT